MKREDIRLERTRRLIAREGGIARFAERLGMATSQVSQFAGRTPTRRIGNGTAEKIEAAYGKPPGWLDTPLEEEEGGADMRALRSAQLLEAERILSGLSDADVSRALGFLQDMASSAQAKPPVSAPSKTVTFTGGTPTAEPRKRRHS